MSKKVSAQFSKHSLKLGRNTARWVAANKPYNEITDDEKKALVQMVFSDKMPDGRRMGVFVEWNKKSWAFDIHGHFIDEEGLIPKASYFSGYDGGGRKQKELLTKYALY
jgi:hypothetical protein